MEFDDSFFEDSDECEDGPKPTEKVLYAVKRCEPEWFLKDAGVSDVGSSGTQEMENHMLLKFQADFLYYRKQYLTAIEVYRRVLEMLPPTNALVRRELTDSLARCQLHLGGYFEALEYAKSLVLPPHARDPTSWQLLAQCHQQLGSVEEQTLALQKSALLQRYHISYWLQLSEGYEALDRCGIKDKCIADHSEQVELILSNTVALFRPYFRWRQRGPTPPDVWYSERPDGHCLQETDSQNRPHGCSALEDSGPDSGNHSLCVLTDGGVRHVDTSGCETANLHTGSLKSGNHGNCQCGNDSCVSGASKACEACPENHGYGDCGSNDCVQNSAVSDQGLPRIEILQSGSMWGGSGESTNMHTGCCAGKGGGSVGCVCPMCSPFCLLVGGKMAAGDFLTRLGELPHETAREMLGSFCTMASCCCLIWARQLLLYSARYSSSFARDKQQEELRRVELLLNAFHSNTKKFLLGHFSQTSVFEDSSDKS